MTSSMNLHSTSVSRPSILNDGFLKKDLLLAVGVPDLPDRTVFGPYRNVTDYLNFHYDLLSEDLIGPTRDGLKEYKRNGCPDMWDGVRVSWKVKLTPASNEQHRGKYWYVNCGLEFMENEAPGESMFGSLLLFTKGNLDDDLQLGKVISDRDKDGRKGIVVEVKLQVNHIIKELGSSPITMIKAEAFYYMYHHVLKVLSSLNEECFPMKKYIVYGTPDTQVGHPAYLSPYTLFKVFDTDFVPVLDPQKWPSCETVDMDECQFLALKTALSNELAVIYGAPGTGKTYFGVRLVKVLLDNMNTWNIHRCTPILVICQSNQALDHFMENLLNFTKDIVRIGDCQSEELMPYSLKALVCRQLIKTPSKRFPRRHILESLLDNIETIRHQILQLNHRHNIVSLRLQLRKQLESLENKLNKEWDSLPYKFPTSLEVLQSKCVVGLTSTGAAARRQYLEKLKAPIVIIEEAGEMLEAHTVVSMTEHCQHLILLGDLKQLKPMVNKYELSRDYNLNVSLFKRLLTDGIVEGHRLTTQYRMRPEISSLLRPHIYDVLYDDLNTLHRPSLRGLSKSVFFLNHREKEQEVGKQGFWNPHEVYMLIYLAHYLVECHKYSPSEITILTMYAEQRKKIIEVRDEYLKQLDIEVASVDAYQGRENEIILLSLVRSNAEQDIGFLKEENRTCVALSRARSGLIMMGNMHCLKTNPTWNKVRRCLESNGQIGLKLTLQCEEHPTSTPRHVSKIEDWRDGKFCQICSYETKRIGDSFDKPVVVDLPESLHYDDVSWRTYKQRGDGVYHPDNRSDRGGQNRSTEQCGFKIFGVCLAVLVFVLIGLFISKFTLKSRS